MKRPKTVIRDSVCANRSFPNRISQLVALLLLLTSVPSVLGQSQARPLQARLSNGRAIVIAEQKPQLCAELVLFLSGAEDSPTGRITFAGMRLEAAQLTAGDFEIFNQQGERLFAGRWVATAFREGATLISLEGEGQGRYAASRLKLKLRGRVSREGDSVAVLSGQGRGEIR